MTSSMTLVAGSVAIAVGILSVVAFAATFVDRASGSADASANNDGSTGGSADSVLAQQLRDEAAVPLADASGQRPLLTTAEVAIRTGLPLATFAYSKLRPRPVSAAAKSTASRLMKGGSVVSLGALGVQVGNSDLLYEDTQAEVEAGLGRKGVQDLAVFNNGMRDALGTLDARRLNIDNNTAEGLVANTLLDSGAMIARLPLNALQISVNSAAGSVATTKRLNDQYGFAGGLAGGLAGIVSAPGDIIVRGLGGGIAELLHQDGLISDVQKQRADEVLRRMSPDFWLVGPIEASLARTGGGGGHTDIKALDHSDIL